MLATADGTQLLAYMGDLHNAEARFQEALDTLNAAMDVACEAGLNESRIGATVLLNRGTAKLGLTDWSGAEEDLECAQRLHETTGSLETPAHSLLLQRRSELCRCWGDVTGSLGLLQQAWHIRVQTGTLNSPEALEIYELLMDSGFSKHSSIKTNDVDLMQSQTLKTWQRANLSVFSRSSVPQQNSQSSVKTTDSKVVIPEELLDLKLGALCAFAAARGITAAQIDAVFRVADFAN